MSHDCGGSVTQCSDRCALHQNYHIATVHNLQMLWLYPCWTFDLFVIIAWIMLRYFWCCCLPPLRSYKYPRSVVPLSPPRGGAINPPAGHSGPGPSQTIIGMKSDPICNKTQAQTTLTLHYPAAPAPDLLTKCTWSVRWSWPSLSQRSPSLLNLIFMAAHSSSTTSLGSGRESMLCLSLSVVPQ